jgi:molybdopterin-synthase adenylyltransferase
VPDASTLGTCETAGVLASAVVTVAAFQWTQAVRLIVGEPERTAGDLLTFDVWSGDYLVVREIARRPDCPCCVHAQYGFLDAQGVSSATTLCGRDAIQVSPGQAVHLDLAAFARRFDGIAAPIVNAYLVKVTVDSRELTVFDDGRAIIRGTSDTTEARALYARWVGA